MLQLIKRGAILVLFDRIIFGCFCKQNYPKLYLYYINVELYLYINIELKFSYVFNEENDKLIKEFKS